jgi:hypothetical protein
MTFTAVLGAGLLLLFVACAPRWVRVSNVYVSYETKEDALTPGISYGPQKVKRLEFRQDYCILQYEDGRLQMVPLNERLIDFRWSRSME